MVAVRVRPMMPKEKLQKSKKCLKVPDEATVQLGTNRNFTYDYAFGPNTSQEKVFSLCVKRLVDGCFKGYNATVFAYGQTGAGKTHTMGSTDVEDITGSGLNDQHGIIPRVVNEIFSLVAERRTQGQGQTDFQLRVSYLEIYNEEVKDLLHPGGGKKKSIDIRENTQGEIIVVGASEENADSMQVMLRALQKGSITRTTGRTNMNDASSRSHSIFTISITQRRLLAEQTESNTPISPSDPSTPASKNGGKGEYITAKFHLVDLAGSERAKKTGAVGLRLRVSILIKVYSPWVMSSVLLVNVTLKLVQTQADMFIFLIEIRN